MLIGLLFAFVALFYASVGFGGGSSYLALLMLWEVDYAIVPAIALICNITVVFSNSIHYVRAGYLSWRLLLPPTTTSIPFAYLGGRMEIGKEPFLFLLCSTLLVTGIRLLLNYRMYDEKAESYRPLSYGIGGLIGAILGFLSGIVGIGGGIFLAPILYNLRVGLPMQIATTSSLFILVNSIAGLTGQLQKSGISKAVLDFWYLPCLVLLGGQLGNLLTIKFIPQRIIALLTACLVLFVAGRLGLLLLD